MTPHDDESRDGSPGVEGTDETANHSPKRTQKIETILL